MVVVVVAKFREHVGLDHLERAVRASDRDAIKLTLAVPRILSIGSSDAAIPCDPDHLAGIPWARRTAS